MKQKIYIEIMRNMMMFLNLRYDFTIKRSMEFFQKVYNHYKDVYNFQSEVLKVKSIDDFIRNNLNEYMPSQKLSSKGSAIGDESNMDNAIFFNDKGEFIGQDAFNIQLLQLFRQSNHYLMDLMFLRIFFRISLQNTKFIEDLKRVQVLVSPQDNQAYSEIKKIFICL